MADAAPTPEEVHEALKRTGFLFEQQAFQFLNRCMAPLNNNTDPSFESELNYLYVDSESGKSREIDIMAEYGAIAGDSSMGGPMVSGHLLVECKNNAAPFAIVGSATDVDSIYATSALQIINDPLRFGWDKHWSIWHSAKLSTASPGPMSDGFDGKQLIRLTRQNGSWKGDNSGVQDSILYPLAKATAYERKQRDDRRNVIPEAAYHFYFPIILTTSPVYSVSVNNEEVAVEQRPWVPLRRRFEDANLRGEFIFEVVHYQYFEEYIEQRYLTFLRSMEKILASNVRFHNPNWLLSNLGDPKKIQDFKKYQEFFAREYG